MRTKTFYLAVVILVCIVLSCCLSSCQSPPPPILDNQTTGSQGSQKEQSITLSINSDAINLLSSIRKDTICSSTFTNGQSFVFNKDDSLFIISGQQGEQELVHEMNFSTGNLHKICRDSLCNHNQLPCVETYYYIAQAFNKEDIYVLGEYLKAVDEGRKFIGKLDILKGTMEVLHEWLPSTSANSLSFEYFDGYLYYTKATSDTTNEIYRFSVTSKKEEKVSSLDEYIVVFAINDNCIYFRDNYYVLKKATMDFKTVQQLDDGVSIIFPLDDKLYYFKNAYTNNGDAAGFNMMCLDVNSLEKTTVLSNTYNPSMTLYDQGSFYYTTYDYSSNKTVFVYDLNSAKTKSYSIGEGSRCDVLGVLDKILVLKIFTDFDPTTGQRNTEYFLFDTSTNQKVQIYCE